MMTITIEDTIWTKIDDETFRTQGGAEMSSWERAESVKMLAWAERELVKAGKRDLTDEDNAEAYLEALEIRNSWDENLELIDTLWPR